MKDNYKIYPTLTALFVAVLIISNIASTKLTQFGSFVLDAGTILFPLSYIFGDVLTEVYGYAKTRRVIWTGFFCSILASSVFFLVQYLPSANDWGNQAAYESILGLVPRIVFASVIAYLVGSFVNSYVISKVKIYTKGKKMWARFIASTICGQFFDTMIFVLIAFAGIVPNSVLLALIISNYVFKVLVEILLLPLTYKLVKYIKRVEGVDYFDESTNFTPFRLRD